MTEQVYRTGRVNVSYTDTQKNKLSVISIIGAIISVNLMLWAGYWAYNIISRDINGIPIVAAQPGPLRVAPDFPGGIEAENIELAVTKIASQELPPNPQAVELAPSTAKLVDADITIYQALKQKKLIDNHAIKNQQGHDEIIEAELSKEVSFGAIKASSVSANYAIVDNQSELVAAALALALKPSGQSIANDAILANINSRIIKPRPRPGSLLVKSSLFKNPNVILPALGLVERGLAVVQFGTFETKEVAFSEWDRLSKNFAVILDGRPKYVERIQRNGNEIYRLRLGGFANLDDANRFCFAVISAENCVPVIAK
jgi:hypothetical protein